MSVTEVIDAVKELTRDELAAVIVVAGARLAEPPRVKSGVVNLKVKEYADRIGVDLKRIYVWARRAEDPLPSIAVGKRAIRIPEAGGMEWAVRNGIIKA